MADGTVFERAPSFRHPRNSEIVFSPLRSSLNDLPNNYGAEQVRSRDPFLSRPLVRRYGSAEPLDRRGSIVLPSIENENPPSPHQQQTVNLQFEGMPRKRKSDGFPTRYLTPPTARQFGDLAGRVNVIDLTNSSERPFVKRQRVDDDSSINESRSKVQVLTGRVPAAAVKHWHEVDFPGPEYIPALPSQQAQTSGNRAYVGDSPTEPRRVWEDPKLANRLRASHATTTAPSFDLVQRTPGVARSALPLHQGVESQQDFRFIANRFDLADATTSGQFPTTFSSSRDSFPSLARKHVQVIRPDEHEVLVPPHSEVVHRRGLEATGADPHFRSSEFAPLPQARHEFDQFRSRADQEVPQSGFPSTSLRGVYLPQQVRSHLDSVNDQSHSHRSLNTSGPPEEARVRPVRGDTMSGREAEQGFPVTLSRRSLSPRSRYYQPAPRYEAIEHDPARTVPTGPLLRDDRRDVYRIPPNSALPDSQVIIRNGR